MKTKSVISTVCVAAVVTVTGLQAQQSTILSSGFPRAGFFRQSEWSAANNKVTLKQWLDAHGALSAIEGKVMAEEQSNTDQPDQEGLTKLDYFNAYKKRYPEKLALVHFNGNARMPTFMREPFFDGHWLYYEGAMAQTGLRATDSFSLVAVDHPERFTLVDGRKELNGSDVCIAALVDGKPDWNRAEQATVTKIDLKNKTITLERGKYGTRKLDFPPGTAYIAAHVAEGPFGSEKGANLLWKYNLSLNCYS